METTLVNFRLFVSTPPVLVLRSTANTINDSDTHNFHSFPQDLRANPAGAKLTLPAATSVTPIRDAFAIPSTNVADLACVLLPS